MNFKLRNLVAATLAGSFLMGFGANAMADSTTDIVDALESKGVLTDEEAALINKGHAGEKEAKTETHKAAAADVSNKPMDFMNDDAPFKSNFTLGEHQADIQIYGIIDVAGASTNHSLPANGDLPNNLYPYSKQASTNPNVKSQSAWINGGLQDSRIGVKGSIGLFDTETNKFKLIYQVESGFNPITGELNNAAKTLADNAGPNANTSVSANSSLNGYMFARQAWAGIDGGSLGKVSYGLQYNPIYEITASYDPTGKADSFSPFGESGTVGGGGGISENSRMKNSIKYANSFAAPMDGKINVAGMYEIGNNIDTKNGYGATGQLGYENSMFGVQMAYDKFTDTVKAGSGTLVNTLAGTVYNTDAFFLAGKVMPTKSLTVYGGWEWYQVQAPTDRNLAYSSIDGISATGIAPYAAGVTQDNNVYYIGAKFDFAENMPALTGLTAALGYYETKNDAPTDASAKAGKIDTTTLVVDYKINKRFDTYFAYTNNHFSGPAYQNSGGVYTYYQNVDMAGVGVRMKF